jgi:putative endonuclease
MYYVYMAECRDGSLYTGVSADVAARLSAHDSGRGAKYTRGRGPLRLRYLEILSGKAEALRREAEIKKLRRSAKLKLAALYQAAGGADAGQ